MAYLGEEDGRSGEQHSAGNLAGVSGDTGEKSRCLFKLGVIELVAEVEVVGRLQGDVLLVAEQLSSFSCKKKQQNCISP